MIYTKDEMLEKLLKALHVAGVFPIPETSFLLSRISLKRDQLKLSASDLTKTISTSNAGTTSPVCFASSAEVQDAYRDEEQLLQQVDEAIEQIIYE